jgi:hypothetical protein
MVTEGPLQETPQNKTKQNKTKTPQIHKTHV